MSSAGRRHGSTPRGRAQKRVNRLHEGRFGQLFPKLSPAPVYSDDDLRQAAAEMREVEDGAPAPQGLWNSDTPQPPAGDNPIIPAGYTYLGQFIDHDITFDATSRLGTAADPDGLVNFRSPRFDLDSLYGSGPIDEPFQYSRPDPAAAPPVPFGRLLVPERESGSGEFDMPRSREDVALIGDPRNDENGIVSQLHVAMLRFHNRVLADVGAENPVLGPDAAFDEARRRVRWHYQWVVVHDYLKRTCGAALVDELLERDPSSGRLEFDLRYYLLRRGQEPFIPVEFSVAAFRFGHSQVRSGYTLSATIAKPTFVPGDEDPFADLRGKPLLPGWGVEWGRFVPLSAGDAAQLQPSRLIDGKLSTALMNLPGAGPADEQSLAFRNLKRGQDFRLPSGQDVARELGVVGLSADELGTGLDPTPLWLYLLLEAGRVTGGVSLGPVGGRIVAETLLGLLQHDPNSYVHREEEWHPELPGTGGHDGSFGFADLIEYATTAP